MGEKGIKRVFDTFDRVLIKNFDFIAREIVKMLDGFDCTVVLDYCGVERIVKAVKKSV